MSDVNCDVQRSLLHLLALAHNARLEPAPLVSALAEEHHWLARRRLNKLASRLVTGTSVIAALEQTPDAISDEDLLTLSLANQSGTLSQAYEQLLQNPLRVQNIRQQLLQTCVYFIMVGLFTALMLLVMLNLIAPTFKHIDEDWGLSSERLSSFVHVVTAFQVWAPWLIGAFLVGYLVWHLRLKRTVHRDIASRISKRVAQLRVAQLLRLLAMSSQAGRPLTGAISTLGQRHFDSNVRAKLLFARNEVEQGVAFWESLSSANLLTQQESTAIANSTSPELQTWLLERLAQHKEDVVYQRRLLMVNLLQPVLTILFGMIVLWIALVFAGHIFFLSSALS